MAVNHLNLDTLMAVGLPEKEAILKFAELVRGSQVILGWNINFDERFLRAAYKRSGIPWTLGHRFLDVQSVWSYVNVVGNNRAEFGGITEAAKLLLKQPVEHNALADAKLTLDLLRALKEIIQTKE